MSGFYTTQARRFLLARDDVATVSEFGGTERRWRAIHHNATYPSAWEGPHADVTGPVQHDDASAGRAPAAIASLGSRSASPVRRRTATNVRSDIGCWTFCGWIYTLVELASWGQPAEQLVDRADRPWDNSDRRPSLAD